MTYDPGRHHRRPIRLRGYDYAEAGAYFVTICVQDRACLLGEVVEGEIFLTDPGAMVLRWWDELPRAFLGVETDAFVVMPNHVHGIIVLGTDPTVDIVPAVNGSAGGQGRHAGLPLRGDAVIREEGDREGHSTPDTDVEADLRVCPASLPRLMQWFKTMTTNEYIRGVRHNGWPPFRGKLWQRNYFERIVRNGGELDRARVYIAANPARWADDAENPVRSP